MPEAKLNRQGDGEVAQDVVTCTFGHMQPKTFTYDYKTVSSMYGTPFVLQVQEDETLQEIFQRCSVFCHATVDEISKWQLVIYDVDGNVDAIEATTVRYDASNQGQNSQLAQTTHAYSTGDPHSMTLTENEESMSLASGTSIDQDTPTATHAFLSLKLLQHPHVQRRIVELPASSYRRGRSSGLLSGTMNQYPGIVHQYPMVLIHTAVVSRYKSSTIFK